VDRHFGAGGAAGSMNTRRFPARLALAIAILFALGMGGCDRREPGQTTRTEPPPVVRVAPVETRTFEDGYAIGFEAGKAAAAPRAKLPPREEVETKASEAAALSVDRNERWQRGWAKGYLEGFQQKSTGLR
jgi:hypothetical protein